MKTIRHASKLLLVLLLITLLFGVMYAGCSSGAPSAPQKANESAIYDEMEYDSTVGGNAPAAAPSATAAPAGSGGYNEEQGIDNAFGVPEDGRKVIRSASLVIETKEFDNDMMALQNKATELGGYIETSNVQGRKPIEWNEAGRNAYMSFRIPTAKLGGFLTAAQSVGLVVEQQLGSDDITSQYFDTESHVNTLRIQLSRLEAILAESAKLEDVLKLETEIARVRYEIEALTTDLKRWDRLVDYATVRIDLYELSTLQRPTNTTAPITLGDRMRDTLSRSFNGVLDFLEDLLIILVALLPVLPILAVIGAIIWLIVRGARKRAKLAEQKRREKFGQMPPNGFYAPSVGFNPPPVSPQAPEQKEDELPRNDG